MWTLRTTRTERAAVVGILAAYAGITGCRSDWTVPDVPQWELAPSRIDDPHRTDRITSVSAPRADFLWVIDDSCSMADEQASLVAAFPAFAERIVDSGLDYHIGVVSTNIDVPWVDGRLHPGPTALYIDTDTDDPIAEFAQMADLGTGGAPFECGLGAAYHALGANVELNGAFYRSDAALHTVVMSDEDDETPSYVVDPLGFAAWYDELKAAAGASPQDLSFSAIVDLDPASVETGSRYLAVTALIGGTAADITADGSWDGVLAEIADQGVEPTAEFFLSQRPVPPTLTVLEERPDGVTLPHGRDAWRYDPVRNSVVFEGYAPVLGAVLVFDYTPLGYAR